MSKYLVGIQLIKVYNVEVEAEDEEGALNAVYDLQSTEIAERGKLKEVETDHAEVIAKILV